MFRIALGGVFAAIVPIYTCMFATQSHAHQSSVEVLYFEDGSTLNVNLPMPEKEFLELLEANNIDYVQWPGRVFSMTEPPNIAENASRAYLFSGGYVRERRAHFSYWAYVVDGFVVHIKTQTSGMIPF